ncbi:MAG: VWA domain-containing protein [Bacteroidetes bacterium]|nr:MAG: VWA domain-containing protein [Bacteroidota bacterium]
MWIRFWNENFFWLSPKHFSPNTLLGYEWYNAGSLYFLLAIPLLFLLRRVANISLRQRLRVAWLPSQLGKKRVRILRFLPDVVVSLALICLVLAVARPQKVNTKIQRSSEGIDIMLCLDVSESMMLEDFQPNRLEVAKQVARNFVAGRVYDRIGLVVFSGEAYSAKPLTTDYALIQAGISEITPDYVGASGTAIGTAIGVATNRLLESNAKSKVIILISDGDNTAGSVNPLTSANLAAYYNMKIYTILVGTEGEIAYTDRETGQRKTTRNTIHEQTLQEIAQTGDGKYFRTPDRKALEEVFERINQYEKSEIKENKQVTRQDFYRIYLNWGLLFLVMGMFLRSTFIANILED